MRKITIFLLLIVTLLLASACAPAPSVPAATPSPTAAPLPTGTPVPPTSTAAPLPSSTPLPATAALSATPACFANAYNPFAFLPGGSRLLGWAGASVQVFDLQNLREVDRLTAPANLTSLALSPDGETLAWALEDNTIQLVRLSDHLVLHTLSGHTDRVTRLKFTPSGARLVSAARDTWVRLWDMDGKPAGAFQPAGADDLPSAVMGIGVSPDGKQLATVPEDGPVRLWDLATYKKLADMGGSGGYDTSDVAFSPDGKLLAADLATGLFIWNAADGSLVLGGDSPVNSMAFDFSPDGRWLAYADQNNVVLSSPDGAQKLLTLEGHASPVWGLFFSPDSAKLVSTDGTEVRIWQAAGGRLLYVGKTACP